MNEQVIQAKTARRNALNPTIFLLGVGALAVFLYILPHLTYFRSSILLQVLDNETKQPIPYALIKFVGEPYGWRGCGGPTVGSLWYESKVVDPEGKASFPRKSFFHPIVGSWSAGCHEWLGGAFENLHVWFPGYKGFHRHLQGRMFLKRNIKIYLERPKTPEEAFTNLWNGPYWKACDTPPTDAKQTAWLKGTIEGSFHVMYLDHTSIWADRSRTYLIESCYHGCFTGAVSYGLACDQFAGLSKNVCLLLKANKERSNTQLCKSLENLPDFIKLHSNTTDADIVFLSDMTRALKINCEYLQSTKLEEKCLKIQKEKTVEKFVCFAEEWQEIFQGIDCDSLSDSEQKSCCKNIKRK